VLDLEYYQTIIPAGQSLSPPVPLGVKALVGLSFDSAWTSPTGGCSFQASPDGGASWHELYDRASGTEIVVAAAAAKPLQFVAISNLAQFAGVNNIKIQSGTAAAPVNQTNSTIITVFCRSIAF
jgi:hypothetical protein